jgi:hypothetical protein
VDKCIQDLAEGWREEKELYDLLLILSQRGIFDADFQLGLTQLAQIAKDKSRVPYLQAQECYAQKNYQEAAVFMRKALQYRGISYDYWNFMAQICQQLGDIEGQYYWAALVTVHGGESYASINLPLDNPKALRVVGQARLNPCSMPFYVQFYEQDGKLTDAYGNLAGQYLADENEAGYRDFCGVYNPRQCLNARAAVASLLDDAHFFPHGYTDFPFDIMRCREEKQIQVECPPGRTCIVPIAAQCAGQPIYFQSGDDRKGLPADKWEFAYFRCEAGNTVISSEKAFHVAEPIWLGHDTRRKKLVLNILTDGLPWQAVKKQGYKSVPNIKRFFSKGVIFDNNFSVSEFTYPALAAIETGCYPYRTQIFNDNVATKLSEVFPVISEQMKALGYYCTNLLSDSAGLFNGVLRGFDRSIPQQLTCQAYEAVERCIEHLDAWTEVDNYVYLHISDAHPFSTNIKLAPYTQVSLPWQERILDEYGTTSVHKKRNALNMTENQYSIAHMDRLLGWLFDYIEEHYAENEYIVNLYSDHGVSVYDKDNYLLSENQSGAALMVRGAGIPHLGLVEELTSVLDLYPLMDKELGFTIPCKTDGHLPKAFGGQGRRYAVSMSIYPGQTFKLCLRDEKYEFRLETKAFTQMSGLVDMRDYSVHIYRRDNFEEVFAEEIRSRFMGEAVKHIQSFAVFE